MSKTAKAKSSSQPSHQAQLAINAANRASEKLRERKRALGQKLVVWQEGKVVQIEP